MKIDIKVTWADRPTEAVASERGRKLREGLEKLTGLPSCGTKQTPRTYSVSLEDRRKSGPFHYTKKLRPKIERTALQCAARGCDGCLVCKPPKKRRKK